MQFFGSHGVSYPHTEREITWFGRFCGGAESAGRVRDPLPKPLMGSGLIEVHHTGLEETVELLLMQDQEMIQTFSPHTSQKPSQTAFARREFDTVCEAP
jgi:hypothetical protein